MEYVILDLDNRDEDGITEYFETYKEAFQYAEKHFKKFKVTGVKR